MSPRVPVPLGRLMVKATGKWVFDPDLPWPEQRRRLDLAFRFTPLPHGTRVAQVDLGGVPAERVAAPGALPARLVVYFHGGGYTVGSAVTARAFAAGLSRRSRATVLLPLYRLAPEHPYPAALDDAWSAWEAATTSAGAGAAAARAVVGGDSAGGGLALTLAHRLRASGRPAPAGLLLVCPWLDLGADRRRGHRADLLLSPRWLATSAAAYAGGHPLEDPALSPMYADPEGLPPALVQGAGGDSLLADADRWVVAARAAGVDVTYQRAPGLWHDFPMSAGLLAAADRAVDAAGAFVERTLP